MVPLLKLCCKMTQNPNIQSQRYLQGVHGNFQSFDPQCGSLFVYLHRRPVGSRFGILVKIDIGLNIIFHDGIDSVGISPEGNPDHTWIGTGGNQCIVGLHPQGNREESFFQEAHTVKHKKYDG